ncbi:MAG: DUF4350 domain-containing protein [Acidobacteriaceae bacterium]|nr:DUF4350 domain-containing protein [Acidobacteriaceae bacterium]
MRGNLTVLSALLLAFVCGLWWLFDLRFASGDIYPPYSSLRSDPQGCRAVYDSLSTLPGFSVERNFAPIEKLPRGKQTLFYLGVSAPAFEFTPEAELLEFEKLAKSGGRVIIAFRSANAADVRAQRSVPPIEKAWGVRFTYVKLASAPDHTSTALFLTSIDPRWTGRTILQRQFDAGDIVLLPLAYPLSNEALHSKRDVPLLLTLLGPNKRIVFDETHLGVVESGSVAGLARKYHLQGVALAFLLLAALFVWKNSSSLLPPRESSADSLVISSRHDSTAGFANLLRRNIVPSRLVSTCLEEWEKVRQKGRAVNLPTAELQRIHSLASQSRDPAAAYRAIAALLSENQK